jgi:hypothetical protein
VSASPLMKKTSTNSKGAVCLPGGVIVLSNEGSEYGPVENGFLKSSPPALPLARGRGEAARLCAYARGRLGIEHPKLHASRHSC